MDLVCVGKGFCFLLFDGEVNREKSVYLRQELQNLDWRVHKNILFAWQKNTVPEALQTLLNL